MPAKYNLLPTTIFNTPLELETITALLLAHAKITRTQYFTILQLCANSYPVKLTIDQRMAKQMLYIVKNDAVYQLNNRSKITYIGENT